MLLNDLYHPFEPTRHEGVIVQKIEWLGVTIWELILSHAWPTQVVHPAHLWPCVIAIFIKMQNHKFFESCIATSGPLALPWEMLHVAG